MTSSTPQSTVSDSLPTGTDNRLRLGALIALVVGSMIGGGIFAMPRQMAQSASPIPLLIGWTITGVGMLTLAFVFQNLASRKPDVDGGVYGYARAGFGSYIGFNSAWGYWISAWLGNVGYLVFLFTALGELIPLFGGENKVPAVIGASVVLWATTWLCIRGVQEAAFVNTVVTIAKVVPLLMFIVIGAVAFKSGIFTADIWGTNTSVPSGPDNEIAPLGSALEQVKGMMLVTVWVFIGIEGASVFSARASKRSDVGKATVIGFLGVLALLVLVNVISYGLMAQAQLAGVKDPALGQLLVSVVGPWGGTLIALGLAISLLGALLSWTLLCAEILALPAQDKVMPQVLGKLNPKGAPAGALLITAVCEQIFLIWSTTNKDAYDALILLASSLILIPYLLSTAYQLKLAMSGETYEQEQSARVKAMVIGGISTIYAVWLLYAAGPKYLLLSALFYVIGAAVYIPSRRAAGEKPFTGGEIVLFIAIAIAAVAGAVSLANGAITL
ncbi:arginine:ornithine antiporter, APA family [Austwickia chelonae]|uniref:Arginine-ornithine antiporter n=1 Tax=Austwickia chelonae NBRC 105200 TaxID=1184607 RepID=K6V3M4_9MICO|nr:arginine-ornithine antiporter [Austwickia chelonae]GAB76683.1 putative arginine/ornithine antiporter [Austwickia chelonae NBRC 105200]SEW29236.1 arginine:ornithine antiporter, APA family [Austwickia chelonae]